MRDDFDFDRFKAQALDQMRSGKPLTGKDGALAPLLENLLNAALEGELNISTPRDRDATFDPVKVKKRERSEKSALKN